MRTIVNKTHRPLRVHLPQGRILHLGPHKEGQIAPQAVESAGVKRLIEAGDLELLGDEGSSDAANRETGHAMADTHGHHPNTSVRSRGDR